MKKIFKYPLAVEDIQSVALPVGAVILTVKTQHDKPVLYAIVDDEQTTKQEYIFYTVGTGHPINRSGLTYVETYMLHNETLVFHVFYQQRPAIGTIIP